MYTKQNAILIFKLFVQKRFQREKNMLIIHEAEKCLDVLLDIYLESVNDVVTASESTTLWAPPTVIPIQSPTLTATGSKSITA